MLETICKFKTYQRSNIVQEGFSLDMTNNDEMFQERESIANSPWNNYNARHHRESR